jgi:hypothetical protein
MTVLGDRILRQLAGEHIGRWSGRLAAAAVLGAGSWVLAGLLWGFAAPLPAPPAMPPESPAAVARQLAAHPLFGSGPPEAAAPAIVPHSLQLLGVLSSRDAAQARAVIRREGEPRPLVLGVGEPVAAGLTLTRIAPRQVTLSAGGGETVLALPEPAAGATSANTDKN